MESEINSSELENIIAKDILELNNELVMRESEKFCWMSGGVAGYALAGITMISAPVLALGFLVLGGVITYYYAKISKKEKYVKSILKDLSDDLKGLIEPY